MVKACVICGDDETSAEKLLAAPCQRHWICTDDVSTFFEHATMNESLYPPQCCDQIFLLELYHDHVPFDVQWAYQAKAQGEYSVLAKYRVYCASPTCSKFLDPSTHVKDPSTNVTYATCQEDICGKLTCTSCKTLIEGIEGHTCERDEDYKKFKQTVTEKGFQECPTCASTVELVEACNHISCECGAEFCYICGKQWRGIHGCPHYGPAIYDEEDYNQDGYHRNTGLNREGRSYSEQRRVNGDEDEDEDDDDWDGRVEDRIWNVLQHVDPDTRAWWAALPDHQQEDALLELQFNLLEERGIQFPDVNDDTNISEFGFQGPPGAAESDNSGSGKDSGAAESGDSDSEENGGAAQNDNAGEGDRLTGKVTASTGTGETTDSESVDAAEDGAQLTVAEMGVDQYVSLLYTGSAGFGIDGVSEDEEETATEFRNRESLADMLRRMWAHAETGMVPRATIRGALDVLQAENEGNVAIYNFRLTLSHLYNSLDRNNTSQDDNGESSSATSSDENQPSTPINVVQSIDQGEEERPAWKGPIGGWPDDEEL